MSMVYFGTVVQLENDGRGTLMRIEEKELVIKEIEAWIRLAGDAGTWHEIQPRLGLR